MTQVFWGDAGLGILAQAMGFLTFLIEVGMICATIYIVWKLRERCK